MFKKKYMFETRRTKIIRNMKNCLVFFSILLAFHSGACLVLILFAGSERKFSVDSFDKKPPDLIAVFTGDVGRIPYAIKIAEKYAQSNIFITGVHLENNVETLLAPLRSSQALDLNLLEIDYLARNTIGNVISTLRHVEMSKGLNRILIISHDYHIMRIKLVMSKLKDSQDENQFFYIGVKTDYSKWRNIKIVSKEFYKLIRTLSILWLQKENNYLSR